MGQPVVHFEVVGRDGSALRTFYSSLFDWKIDADNPMDYGMVDNGGQGINGGVAASQDGSPTVCVYIQVADPQAALDKAEKLGGTTVLPPSDVPGGPSLALFTDPAGNRIGLAKGM